MYSISLDNEIHKYQLNLVNKASNNEEEKIENDLGTVLFGLQNLLKDKIPTLKMYSVHTRGDQIVHGHGYFCGKLWQDWALIDWGIDGKLPAKIWGFLDLSALSVYNCPSYGGILLKPGTYAVIESAVWVEDEELMSLSEVFIPIMLDVALITNNQVTKQTIFLADVEAIVEPIAVIPDIGGPPNSYFRVKECKQW